MKNISFKGIILGILAMIILDSISGITLMTIFLENTSPEAISALYNDNQPLMFAIFFGTLSTLAGGYISAKYGNIAPYLNSFIIGLLSLGLGFLVMDKYPLWFNVLGFITVIPISMLGGFLVARRSV